MFAYLSIIGLGLIIISWIIQIIKLAKKDTNISKIFAGLQFLGILLLIIDGYKTNLPLAIANSLSAIGALIVFFMVKCSCKNCKVKKK